MYLRYNELRLLMADQSAFDAQELVSDRRDDREDAAERRPPSWVGTATRPRSTSRTTRSGASRRSSTRASRRRPARSRAWPRRPAWSRAPARFVASLDEFDQVKEGEILVCRMTNPAWVVLFTKITGLVTEAGGTVVAPGGRRARVRDPGRGRHHQRRASGSRPATASASTAATGVVEILA